MSTLRYSLPVTALFFSTLQVSAHAASMQKVEQSAWLQGATGLPSYVNMYVYVPDQLADVPPIVVAPHHCQGTASSTNSEMASLRAVADTTGFIMIMPEATGQNCWDAGSTRSLKHGGGGDTGAIVQMVNYAVDEYGADPKRVYAVGGSSGGIMTEALLGVYPDVFLAGVSLMGVPCGCWAEGYNDVTGNGGTAQWSSCAGGNVTKTAEQWGNLVRSYYPEYTGHRPRLQHWHGENDTTINYKVVPEDIKEWTNVLELETEPTGSDMPKSSVTREYWKSMTCDFTVFEVFHMAGVAHNVPTDGPAIAAYFGLDVPGKPDPEVAACEPNSGGTGGASSGGGGTSASGGDTASGGETSGVGGAGGLANVGGAVGVGGSAAPAVGGAFGSGGADGGSGAAVGGLSSTGGVPVTGGVSGVGSAGGEADSGAGCSCSEGPRQGGQAAWALVVSVLGGLALSVRRARRAWE